MVLARCGWLIDFATINISSPNTENLRDLQAADQLERLLQGGMDANFDLARPVPLFVKIAPDLTNDEIDAIAELALRMQLAGIIATNTTISREGLKSPNQSEIGGLSGKPLTHRSTEVIRFLSEKSQKAFPIVGVGGIHRPKDAIAKLNAGADLVQLYTGFVYEGPAVVRRINKALI